MKNYQKPEVEIVKFDAADAVMTALPGEGGVDNPGSSDVVVDE